MATQEKPVRPPRGVIIDVDGTLLDTNYLHVVAWWEAFREHGYDVTMADVHAAVGQGSQRLVETLIGRGEPAVSAAHGRYYAPYLGRVRPFPRAADLLRATARLGLSVVLASSAKSEELDLLLDALGAREMIAAVSSSKDVERTKPEPDLLLTAMADAGLEPAECVMVGDTGWDVEASDRAAIPCIAVRTGGWSDERLRDAGAAEVYDDVAALLENLDASLIGRLARTDATSR